MNDNQRLIEHSLTIADLPQINIEDAEQVAERTRLYINYCLDCDILPTIQGLSLALGIDRRTFTRWESGLTRQQTHQGLMRSFPTWCLGMTNSIEVYDDGGANPGTITTNQIFFFDEDKLNGKEFEEYSDGITLYTIRGTLINYRDGGEIFITEPVIVE